MEESEEFVLLPESGMSDEEDGQEGGQGFSCKEMFVEIWIRLWSVVVYLATLSVLITFVMAYREDAGSQYDNEFHNIITDNMCRVQVENNSMKDFEDLVDRGKDVLYVQLFTSSNVNQTNNTSIYQPKEWMWTRGDSAILVWPESYELWSFGILDLHTVRNVSIQLDLQPPGCSFMWGEKQTTLTVGKALLKSTRRLLGNENKLKQSKWCYKVRMRNVTKNPGLEQDFSFFVQDLGYKCCKFKRNQSDIVPTCYTKVYMERLWSHIPFAFAFVTLLISADFAVRIYRFFSFKPHFNSSDQTSSRDEWEHTDYKSTITFLSCLQVCCCCTSHCLTHILKSVFSAVAFVMLSLSVIILSLVLYLSNNTSYYLLQREIKNDIPIGFLSLLFSYEDNHDNFMFHLKGPHVFISVYCTFSFFYTLVFQCCQRDTSTGEHSEGIFTLNLDLVMKHGRIKHSSDNRYGLLEIIHANSRAIFRGKFWCELLERLFEIGCLLKCSDQHENCSSLFFKIITFPLGLMFSLCVHLSSFLFANILILTVFLRGAQLRNRCRHWCLDIVFMILVPVCHLILVFCFTVIYFGSAEFVFLVFSFCVLSIVFFPGAASGIFVFVLVGIVYTFERLRNIAKKYATYRDLAILINQELCDKCKGAEARISADMKELSVEGVDLTAVRYILVAADPNCLNGVSVRKMSLHCHTKGETLKVIVGMNRFKFDRIAISGIQVDVRHRSLQEDQSNLLWLVESKDSQLKLVLQTQAVMEEILPNSREEETCYVTYRNGLPGIPSAVMETIVEKHIPFGREILRAIIWILYVSCVIAWLSVIIARFEKWEQMSTIMNALILVLLVRASDVFRMFSVDVGEAQKKDILKAQLRLTVQEYWMKKRYSNQPALRTHTVSETGTSDLAA